MKISSKNNLHKICIIHNIKIDENGTTTTYHVCDVNKLRDRRNS